MTSYAPQNILVTGGGGFLGKAVVTRLLARGDRVASFSRGKYPELVEMGAEEVRGDLCDGKAVERACIGRDVVFHVAAKPPPWGRYQDYVDTNVTGTENVIAGCLKHRVGRLIYTSTPSVVFDGSDMAGVDESVPYPAVYNAHYPATKALAEKRVVKAAQSGLRTVALRPHQIWGPGDPHFVPRLIARARRLKRIGDSTNRVDTTYIDNAVDAHLLAADRLSENAALSGKIYFISDGNPVSLWEMIDAILAAAGKPPIEGTISFSTARAIGAVMEFFFRVFRLPGEPPMTRFLADAVAKTHWFNIDAARKDLGYTPKVSIQVGLVRLESWLREETRFS